MNPATARRSSTGRGQPEIAFHFPLDKTDGVIIGVGIAVMVIGYLLMSTAISDDVAANDGVWNNPSAVTVAPILLVLAYCVIIPYAILRRRRSQASEPAPTESGVS